MQTRLVQEINAWQADGNNKACKVKWQFTTENAKTKLHKGYPTR